MGGVRARRRVRPALAVMLAGGLLVFALLAVVVPSGAGSVAAAEERGERARRVLVLSIPYVSWADVGRVETPNLDRFTARAALGALSTRVDRRFTPLADGYATLGAGTRTVGVPEADGDGLMVDERFGLVSAGDAFTQRTGRKASGDIVQTGIVAIRDANARLHYDTEVGALAAALERAGIDRAVIGNADGRAPDAASATTDVTPGPARQRQAVLGLMDPSGEVASGAVAPNLLEAATAAPFGVRLDHDAVEAAFTTRWRDRTVALVEASDLVRAARYEPYVSSGVRERQRDAALRSADRLLGRLLDHVDLDRDVVIVAGPAHAPDRVTLTPLAIRGPGFEPGLLRSPTTRRAGFVQVQDLAPTILHALGVETPSAMEGRPATVVGAGGDAASRLARLRDADAAAQFRDARIGEVYAVLAAGTAIVVGAGMLALWWAPFGRRARARRGVAFLALWLLELLAAAFLVRLVPLHEWGVGAFYAAWLAVGALVAAGCAALGRRRPLDGLVTGLLVIVVVLALDALRGAPLVLNSVLGYSPTVAGRFAGFGNPAYAAFSAAALLAAVLLAHRVGGARGLAVAAALLGVALVVDVAPMWGSDVGGILSMVPAYAVTIVALSGRRVRVRTLGLAVGAVAGVLVVAAVVDFARPARDRTHLGRMIERVRDNGLGEGWSIVERKLAANLGSIGTSILGVVLLVAVVAFVALWVRDPERVRAVLTTVPEWRAGCLGFAVLAVLGFALNDSGMTVPGIMLVVFVAAWVHLLVIGVDLMPTRPRTAGGRATPAGSLAALPSAEPRTPVGAGSGA